MASILFTLAMPPFTTTTIPTSYKPHYKPAITVTVSKKRRGKEH